VTLAAALVFLGTHLALWPKPLPRLENVIYDFGVGPLLLRGDGAPPPVHFGKIVWWAVTVACAGSIAVAVAQLVSCLRAVTRVAALGEAPRARPGRPAQYVFLAVLAVALVAGPYNAATPIYYDRYLTPGLIPLVVLLTASASAGARPQRVTLPVLALTVLYVFSLAGVQDYLAWNRARWEGIGILQTKYGAPEHAVDGGFEYVGLHARFPSGTNVDEPLGRSRRDFSELAWNQYVVSYAPLAGYEELDRVAYFSWLGFEERDIHLLKRVEMR
jgi:hypothetical protein